MKLSSHHHYSIIDTFPFLYYSEYMKQYITTTLTLLFLLSLLGAPLTLAQTTDDQSDAEREARIADAKEEHAAKRQEFQEKLAELKSARKQKIVENTDERISKINETRTDRLSEHLNTMSEILDRVEAKAGNLDDSTHVDEAIEQARAAIETAQSAVEAQAGNEYIVAITDEEELQTVVKAVVDEFKADMKALIGLVKDAHKETREAAQALGSSQKTEEE